MFKKISKIVILIIYSFIIFGLCGCEGFNSPSYPKEILGKTLEQTIKAEYNIDVKAIVNGKTLGVYLPLRSLLDENNEFDKEALSKIENCILCIHRAILSTDKELNFYTLTAVDITTIGVEFTITGNVEDVKKVRYLQISREEYFKRLARDVNLSVSHIGDKKGTSFVVWDIPVSDFLAKQISRRIQSNLSKDKNFTDNFKIDSLEGNLTTSIDGVRDFFFKGTIRPISNNADYDTLFVQPFVETTSHVINAYDFKNFDIVSLYNLSNNIQNQWTKADILAMKVN